MKFCHIGTESYLNTTTYHDLTVKADRHRKNRQIGIEKNTGFLTETGIHQNFFCYLLSLEKESAKFLNERRVEVTGLEPATAWSQTRNATNCATPRCVLRFVVSGCKGTNKNRETSHRNRFFMTDIRFLTFFEPSKRYKNKIPTPQGRNLYM